MRLFLIFTLVLSVAGCTFNKAYVSPTQRYSNGFGDDSGNVTEEKQQQLASALLNDFPEIPVPVGYRVDLTQSTSFYSANYSAGKIILIGSSPSGALFNFFAEEMASKGWTLVNKMQSEVSILNFAKPGRFVAIQIFLNGKITIFVSPE
ncbi:MAG: hypothetical protein GY793_04850 [Proteobacteria bacterium]|nr:hypothetical protein [Pseudomonadota bacterium]